MLIPDPPVRYRNKFPSPVPDGDGVAGIMQMLRKSASMKCPTMAVKHQNRIIFKQVVRSTIAMQEARRMQYLRLCLLLCLLKHGRFD